jgi:hypothetical protein
MDHALLPDEENPAKKKAMYIGFGILGIFFASVVIIACVAGAKQYYSGHFFLS